MPNTPDPSNIVDDLTPELKEGPLGIPIPAPKGAPEPPTEEDAPSPPNGGL